MLKVATHTGSRMHFRAKCNNAIYFLGEKLNLYIIAYLAVKVAGNDVNNVSLWQEKMSIT